MLTCLLKKITPPIGFLLVALISAISLIAAFVAQYGFDLAPCQFCIWERYPYAIALILGLMGAWRGFPVLRWILILVFLGATGLTLYHVGVEREFIDPPAACISDLKITSTTTVDDLRAQIMAQPRVTRCDLVPIKIFGLSIAEYNLLLSLFLAFFCFYFLGKRRS